MSELDRGPVEPVHRQLLARIHQVSAQLPFPITDRQMFGGTMAYADGRPLASLSDAGLAVKLASADQVELLDVHGAARLRYGPDQPESRQYLVLPQAVVGDDEALVDWLTRSARHVGATPTR